MAKPEVTTGYSKNNLPYIRIGSGSGNLVIFEGLSFNHKPPSGRLALRMSTGYVKRLAKDYKVYMVSRKPGLPAGYSMRDMSDNNLKFHLVLKAPRLHYTVWNFHSPVFLLVHLPGNVNMIW